MNEIDNFLKDAKMSLQQLDDITLSGKVLEFDVEGVKVKESKINGLGIIAVNPIKKDSIVGLATINKAYKTILGRYTNHSSIPNCRFQILNNGDFVMVSLKNIKVGEELIVDYKDHYLSPSYYLENKEC